MNLGPKKKTSIHANLPNRFCYWQGEHGHSYLFSRIELKDLSSFSDCVLLVSIEAGNQAPDLLWVGHISNLPSTISSNLQSQDSTSIGIYVHLLAGNIKGQKEVIDDLCYNCERTTLESVA